mmetsp:Transcript_48826/g.104216  ORF Transcript_48826/g.104216 Transcript_48826/m.104216 type:complete len:705 (-) Transcript_48826:323-2437(-)
MLGRPAARVLIACTAFEYAAGHAIRSTTSMASTTAFQKSRSALISTRASVNPSAASSDVGDTYGSDVGDTRAAELLLGLRKEMVAAGVSALVVPSGDAHLSEYVHPHYERRAFVSGFTGSAGTVLITEDAALLWTDGRYFLQAESELGPEWTLMRTGQPGVPTIEEYVASLPDGTAVGIDPYVHSVDEAERYKAALSKASRSLTLVPLTGANLVDAVWDAAWADSHTRPPRPQSIARALPLEFSGRSVTEKLDLVASSLLDARASAYLVSALDEVAWIFNVRAADVPHCPVLQAYGIVHRIASADGVAPTGSATLFVDSYKIPDGLRAQLHAAGVQIRPYEEAEAAVVELRESGGKLLLDPKQTNYALLCAAGAACVRGDSPISLPKASKNDAELRGMMQAHLVDGAALANFFGWLTRVVRDEGGQLSEAELAASLSRFRAAQPGFMDLSFPTIAGCGPNGAVIHYNPLTAPVPAMIDGSQMLLLDSGGQYESGTTDVTRTIHMGTPTPWQREVFTRVLKGNIALDTCVFPEGTPGMAIDALARLALWRTGLDYLHGTGHGVGAALNVHEGPQSISARYANTVGLANGMVLSNEPGYYEAGAFGVRIENLLVVRPAQTKHTTPGRTFMCFDQLTHVPIQRSLIDPALLTAVEMDWVDSYHARVWERVSPFLEARSEGLSWLRESTLALDRTVRAPPVPSTAASA